MELAQLQHFCVLAETENIVDASQILCISQPALTVSIQRLESELGTPLFDRSNHKLVLNEAGKQALPYGNSRIPGLRQSGQGYKRRRPNWPPWRRPDLFRPRIRR